jgi:xylitol oxidase
MTLFWSWPLQASLEKEPRQRDCLTVIQCARMASFVLFVMLANLVILGEATPNLNSTCVPENVNLTNWAANVVFRRDCLQEAASVKAVQALVQSNKNVKVFGTRHCFNTIADTEKTQLSLLSMHKVVNLNPKARTVTVDAGITYTQLCPYLNNLAFALPR